MKALKIWGWLLFASSVILYLIGLIGGEFNSNVGVFFYGTSKEAMLLSVFSAFCFLLSATVMFVVLAINGSKDSK